MKCGQLGTQRMKKSESDRSERETGGEREPRRKQNERRGPLEDVMTLLGEEGAREMVRVTI